MNDKASFDSLAIPSILDAAIGPATSGEIHLFSYLACLLYLYRGNPLADWGYDFTATESGAPYSYDVDQAISFYSQVGFLKIDEELVSLTQEGREELVNLSTLSTLQTRLAFLEPACSSALAVPVGLVRAAVHLDINVSSAVELQSSRHLFDRTSMAQLYEQFDALRSVLGPDQSDLLSPAVTWATYFGLQDLAVLDTMNED